ncbi:hypothetical protein [Fontivita pretiosa]|jgi:DNA-binding NarL/FixJ family response regulator|uniref:hypothetical protein n=1 Tax=Fontivita pretiosa TaxID=2989684 RepID=UPI003D169813
MANTYQTPQLQDTHPTPRLSLLAVCIPGLVHDSPLIELTMAPTARQALLHLRQMSCDLLLTGNQLPDMNVWTLVSRLRASWPQLRWALVCTGALSPQEEIRARCLGATMLFDTVPDGARLHELARSLLARRNTEPPSVQRTARQLDAAPSP